MNYIISPFAVYAILNMDSVKDILIVVVCISATAGFLNFIGALIERCNEQYGKMDADYVLGKNIRELTHKFVPVFIISSILLCLFPSQESIIATLIAKRATVENVQASVDTIKSACDYIINAINSVG